jgi:flagellar biosynthetic protein FliQ
VTVDGALSLMSELLRTAVLLAGPPLGVSLLAGLLVGVVQTATQVNEASVSFVVKVVAVTAVMVGVGPTLAAHMVSYTTRSLEAVAHVVR